MPEPVNPAPQKRVTVVRTQTPTNTVVRSSLLLMTVAATVSAGVLLAALVIQSLPKRVFEVKKVAAVTSPAGYEGNILLVKFADAKLTDKQRIAAVNAALKKPVQCTRTETVRVRQGLRRVSKQVDVGYNCTVKVQRMTPVVPAKEAGAVLAANRAKKIDAAATKVAYQTLQQYSIITLTGTRVQIPTAIAALKAAGISADANGAMGIAALPKDPRVAAAFQTLGVGDAQTNAYGVLGDANGDGSLTWADPEVLVQYIFSGGAAPTNRTGADMNADGLLNISDVVQMVQTLVASMSAPNDLTSDAKVNMDDVHFLQRYIFSGGAAPVPLASADYSADGKVNVSDLVGYGVYVQTHPAAPVAACTRGDANADGKVDLADVTAISDYIFQGTTLAGIACADVNSDGKVNISDAVALVALLQNPVATTDANGRAAVLGVTVPATDTPTDGDPGYLLGDVDASNRVNSKDVTALLNYIFQGAAAPSPLARADMNGDGLVNIADGVALTNLISASQKTRCQVADLNNDGKVDAKDPTVIIDYIFSGGAAPDATKADVDNDGLVTISDAVALSTCVQLAALPVAELNKVNTNSAGTEYLLGDVNNNGVRNLDDAQYIIDYIFNNGPAPVPMEAGDIDGNGVVNISDVVALVNLLDILANTPVDLPVLYGDANKDGAVDSKDIEALTAALIAKQTDAQLDVNRDGKANIVDAYYLPQLLDVDNASKPLPDVNGDGKVNMGDVDYLLAYIFAGGPAPANMSAADVNGDGKVNISDVVAMTNALTQQGALQYMTGDANRDGQVTMADAQYLIAYIFNGGPAPDPLLRGDVSGDGTVNVTDVVILVQRFNQVQAPVGTPETLVAVVDTGVKTSGSVLKAAAVTTKDVPGNKQDDDRNGYVDDAYGWNTLVAGGTTNDLNGHGTTVATAILQVAPKADILPVTVLDRSGMGTCLSVARGLIYATQQGADVANLSASGKGTCALLSDVAVYAQARGTVSVFAAGNDSAKSSTTVQGKVAAGLVVGALDGTAVAKYSNTGATIVAPGVSTASQGTSLSAAYTSGCSALVLTKQASLTPVKVLERLTTTAKSAALRCDLATNF